MRDFVVRAILVLVQIASLGLMVMLNPVLLVVGGCLFLVANAVYRKQKW